MKRHQHRYAWTRGATLMLAALVVVTGCTNSRSPQPVTRSTGIPAGVNHAALAVLASTASSIRMNWYVDEATNKLTASCMKRHGYAYSTPDQGPEPSMRAITPFALGTGRPATYGVAAESLDDPPAQPDQNRPGYDVALNGRPTQIATVTLPDGEHASYGTTGCLAATRTELYGSARAYVISFYVPQIEGQLFADTVTRNQSYLAALHRWQACMKTSGFSVGNPQSARDSLQRIIAAGLASPAAMMRRQTMIANADTRCDWRSRLRERTRQALARFIGTLSPEVLAQLANVSRSQTRAYQIAQRVVTSQPGPRA